MGKCLPTGDNSTCTWRRNKIRKEFTWLFNLFIKCKFIKTIEGLGIPHEISERDLVDEGIKKMALEFLQVFVIQMPSFHEFSFSVDLIDSILKNLICYFPEKVIFNIKIEINANTVD